MSVMGEGWEGKVHNGEKRITEDTEQQTEHRKGRGMRAGWGETCLMLPARRADKR